MKPMSVSTGSLASLLACFLVPALLAGCSQPEPPKAQPAPVAEEEPILSVYNWADYIAPEALHSFERETGIKVVYDTFDGNETLAARLDEHHYDLVFPSARPWAARFVADQRLLKLDKGQLEGLGQIDAQLIHGLAEVDPGNRYLVPYLWGTTGLAIDTAKVRGILGDQTELDSWNLLFDPAQVEKLSACGVVVVEDMTDVMSSALIAAHRSTLAVTDADLAEAERMLMAIRPFVRIVNADEFDDELADGRACLVLGYSGDLARARTVAAESGRIVEYVIPRDGAVRWVDVMAIPANAPHPRNAHRLINHLLKPEVIAKISNELRYANANVEATALLDESLRADHSVFPDTTIAARLVDAPILPDDRRAQWRAIWARFVAEQTTAMPAATTTPSG